MLSLTIITKNEEANLTRLFAHFEKYRTYWENLISEILIVDSFSTDKTKQIATAHPLVHFVEKEFLGFGEQKKLATDLCKNDWVLNLDADELPNEEFFISLKNFFLLKKFEKYDAMYMHRDTYFLGKRLKYAAGNEQRVRFFNRTKFNWNGKKTHEDVEPLGSNEDAVNRIGDFDGRVMHYSWHDIESAVQLQNLYSTRYANNKPKLSLSLYTYFNIIFRFEIEFLKRYFFRLGFLDGLPGFIFSYLMAFSHAVKYMKIYERNL